MADAVNSFGLGGIIMADAVNSFGLGEIIMADAGNSFGLGRIIMADAVNSFGLGRIVLRLLAVGRKCWDLYLIPAIGACSPWCLTMNSKRRLSVPSLASAPK